MSEKKLTHGEIKSSDKNPPKFTWRQGMLGAGLFTLILSLFISAGAKGALGILPGIVAGLGVVLLLVPIVAELVIRPSSDSENGKGASA
jgi:hypothetical protein